MSKPDLLLNLGIRFGVAKDPHSLFDGVNSLLYLVLGEQRRRRTRSDGVFTAHQTNLRCIGRQLAQFIGDLVFLVLIRAELIFQESVVRYRPSRGLSRVRSWWRVAR